MYGKTQLQTVSIIKIHKLYLIYILTTFITTFLKKTKIHLKIMLQSRVEDIYTQSEEMGGRIQSEMTKNT